MKILTSSDDVQKVHRASLESCPEVNGVGRTIDEAIGNLVKNHTPWFEIEMDQYKQQLAGR